MYLFRNKINFASRGSYENQFEINLAVIIDIQILYMQKYLIYVMNSIYYLYIYFLTDKKICKFYFQF